MSKKARLNGVTFLQIALGLFFIAIGILGLLGGNEQFGVSNKIFTGTVQTIVNIVLSIVYLLTGIALIATFFFTVKWLSLSMLVVGILWIVSIVLRDILGGINTASFAGFLGWLVNLCRDVVFAFGIWVCAKRN